MARRKARKIPPTELTIFSSITAAGTYVCDLGSLMSQINRKTFRQGMQYAVESVEFYTAANEVTVARLPHSWPSVNAWTKTMALWKQQQDDRLDDAGLTQTIAAHRDFKIFIDKEHAEGNYTELLATTLGTGAASDDYRTQASAAAVSASVTKDWEYSEVVIPNHSHVPGATEEYYCHMIGDDSFGGTTASFGMVKAYAESRNRPMQTDPNIVDVASGGIFGQMFNIGDDVGEIVENAQDKNTSLPYLNDMDSAEEFYPGGANQGNGLTIVDQLSIQSGNRTMASSVVGPFLANCGLLVIGVGSDEPVNVKITLAPGEYKGVMARPMQDVN